MSKFDFYRNILIDLILRLSQSSSDIENVSEVQILPPVLSLFLFFNLVLLWIIQLQSRVHFPLSPFSHCVV